MTVLLNVLRYFFMVVVAGTIMASIFGALFFLHFARDIPSLSTIADYKPPVVTRVLGKGGTMVGEFFEERRYILPLEDIPQKAIDAFVAAEDDRFFEHQGVDFLGMLRAAFVNFKAGHVVQGGSTITQQVAKSLLLTPERSFTRKIREVIIASRMEKNLTKKEILFLYMNQIYFGEGAYGVETAARTYFNKGAKEMTLAEAAILAGLPQAPSRYSPLQNPKRAKERQQYVLGRLLANGRINQSEYQEALNEPVRVYLPKNPNNKYAPYYIEHVRRYLLEKYGKEALYQGGLTVKTPIDPELSITATKSVQDGLRSVDKRHGYRGPLARVKGKEKTEEVLEEITQYNLLKSHPFKVILPTGVHAEAFSAILPDLADTIDALEINEVYKALVVAVDDRKKEVLIDMGLSRAVIPLEKMKWAVPAKTGSQPGNETILRPSQALSKNSVILARLDEKPATKGALPTASLEQTPDVQGALLSMDHSTGEVLAMVGGYDFEESEFNRAVQAERQPGSAYKPIIYAAAVDRGYTPVTIIQDSPLVFSSGDNEKWKPVNYDEHFSGDTTFRVALIKSMNIPTIKIVQDIGIPYLMDYTKRMGITKALNPDYSIALGSSSVSLLDLVRIYSIFPRNGRKIRPIFISQVLDREGKTLEETLPNPQQPGVQPVLPSPPKPILVAGQLAAESDRGEGVAPPEWAPDPSDPDRVMDPRTAYVMTHLMTEVTSVGTGAEAKNLKRAAAGKTGTTNDYMDAWFMGFTPHVTTGVWVGFDTLRSLGPRGTGGMTSLPIWLDFMMEAVKGYPDVGFTAPPGVTFAHINGTTGRIVSSTTPGAVREAFIEGTEPRAGAARGSGPAQSAGGYQEDSHTEDFLKEDFQ